MIRSAVEADIPRLVEMGERFRHETKYAEILAPNTGQMAKLGKTLIDKDGLLVVEHKGELIGMLGFIIYDHFISGEKTLGEVFWWVEPEYRGEGLRLLREAERIGREAGCKNIQMIAPNENVARLYALRDYDYVESTWQRAL